MEREREKEIKELSQSRPGIEEGSSLSSFQSIRKEMRSCGIVLEAKPGLGDAIWLGGWLSGCSRKQQSDISFASAYLVSPGAGPGTMTQCSPVLACRKQWLGVSKGTAPFCSTQPLLSLNGVQGVTRCKVAALHLTGVQQRTQRFVSTLSV